MEINIDGTHLNVDSNVLRNYKFLNCCYEKRLIKNLIGISVMLKIKLICLVMMKH